MVLKYNQRERSIFDFEVEKDFKDFLCIEILTEATVKRKKHTKIKISR